jgi:hypothetical protein
MQATALIYSGRPNPTWPVEAELGDVVKHALTAMAQAAPGGPERPGLGYSGVQLSFEDESGAARAYTLFGGIAAGEGKRLRDADRKVERRLLESGAAHFPQLRAFL